MTDLVSAIQSYRQAREASHPLSVHVPSLEFGSPWELHGDFLIVGDVHVPSTDWEMAALVAEIGKRHLKKPRKLIVAGDLLNMDKFSVFPHISTPPTWTEERAAAEALLSSWLKTFDLIYWFVGNHERRLQKIMVEVLETTDLLSVIISNPDRAKFSNFSYCYMTSGGVKYLVVHTRNYSRIQLNVARLLSEKNQCHVISFHEHHLSMGWDHSANHLLVNGGALVDVSKVAYMSLDMTTMPISKSGFVMVRNGVPTLFGAPPMTDWSRWV